MSNAMPLTSSEAWALILKITGPLGLPEVDSLRVLLWLEVFQQETPPASVRLKAALAGWRNLIPPPICPVPSMALGKHLICVPYTTPATLDNVLPVIRESLDKNRLAGIVAGTGVTDHLKAFHGRIPIVTYKELLGPVRLTARLAARRQAKRILADLISSAEPLAPALASRLRLAAGVWLNEIAFACVMGEPFGRHIERWKPSTVVSTSDFFPLEHSLVRRAALLGVPTAVIQHGITDAFWWPFTADTDLLWGEAFKREMVALGAPPHRLHAAGMVSSDGLFQRFASTPPVREPSPPLSVVLLSNTHCEFLEPEMYGRYRELLVELVPRAPFIRWLVKLHPAEPDAFYLALPDGARKGLQIMPRSVSLADAVGKADVVCTVNSTAGLEAMIMRKPLLVLDTVPSVRTMAWWPTYGGGTFASTADDALAYLASFQKDASFRRQNSANQESFLSEAFANPGNAARAVFEFLERAPAPSAGSGRNA